MLIGITINSMADEPREEPNVDNDASADPGEPVMQAVGEADPGPPDMQRIALGGRERGETSIILEEPDDPS